MATGTTTLLNESRSTIISDAMMILGENEVGETISDADMQFGVRFLNRMIKQWQAQGIHIWTNSYATLYLEVNQPYYVLGNEAQAGAHWAEASYETITVADAIETDTFIIIADTTLLTIGDHIGICDNANNLQWTTVSGLPSSTRVNLTAPLAGDVDQGNYVFSYTTRPASGAPLRILDANMKNGIGSSSNTVLMPGLAFNDYFSLPNKEFKGIPVNWTYQKDINTGSVRVWPNVGDATRRLVLNYTRQIFNFDQLTDTQDVADEWLQAIVYNLAVVLAPAYGANSLLQTLKPMADEMLAMVNEYDQEDISMYVCGPSRNRY